MDADQSYLTVTRLFAFLCFYTAISYGIVAYKYLIFFKVAKALRPLLAFIHLFIAISNIIGFLIFVFLDRHTPLSIFLSYAGLAITIAGIGFLLWAILTLRIITFIPSANKRLITYGPYQITAHPMYLGGVITGFGLAIWSASTLSLVYVLVIALTLIIISRIEERDLIERFGNDYLEYKKKTLLGSLLSISSSSYNPPL